MRTLICFFLTIFLFTLSNCYGAEKIIVLLDWFANPDHAPLFIAKEKGFFKKQNIDVELIGPADSADPPKLVAADKADIAITYQPSYLEQIDHDLPLIMIGSLIDKPLNCLVVKKKSKNITLADLKNKRIGYSGGELSNITLKVMLQHQRISTNDLQLINIHYALTQALLSDKVNAVTGMMRNFEIIQLELLGQSVQAFYPEENGMPTYSELIFVANRNQIQSKRKLFSKFFIALNEAVAYVKKHPEETWELFSKSHPELNNTLNHRAWLKTIPYFSDDAEAINIPDFIYFAKFMQENGLIKKVQPLSNYLILKE